MLRVCFKKLLSSLTPQVVALRMFDLHQCEAFETSYTALETRQMFDVRDTSSSRTENNRNIAS